MVSRCLPLAASSSLLLGFARFHLVSLVDSRILLLRPSFLLECGCERVQFLLLLEVRRIDVARPHVLVGYVSRAVLAEGGVEGRVLTVKKNTLLFWSTQSLEMS